MDNFVNLHVHTHFSIQDSVIKPENLSKQISNFNQKACAITDHSSTAGWREFSQAMMDYNIKPIFGNEFYCVEYYEDDKSRRRDHLVLLAMNDKGLKNINKLQNIAVQHHYYRPILSYEVLEKYTKGIYCTSACSLGTIAKAILEEDYKNAECWAEKFSLMFKNNFSLELQFHPDYSDQAKINNYLPIISRGYDIPLTVSCDSHFINEKDRKVRRALQAISWHKSFKDVDESLKSNCVGSSDIVLENAILSGFSDTDIVKQAINQTSIIADKCNAKLPKRNRKIPKFNKHIELQENLNYIYNNTKSDINDR